MSKAEQLVGLGDISALIIISCTLLTKPGHQYQPRCPDISNSEKPTMPGCCWKNVLLAPLEPRWVGGGLSGEQAQLHDDRVQGAILNEWKSGQLFVNLCRLMIFLCTHLSFHHSRMIHGCESLNGVNK